MRLQQLIILLLSFGMCHAQEPSFQLKTFPEECEKGSARLTVSGTLPKDSVRIEWSTGQLNLKTVPALEAGSYSVRVYIRRRQDTLVHSWDTTLAFNVEKTLCPVSVSRHFSPNDDGYNDLLNISNAQYYPDFEFQVFNRWGQRVHFQEKTFEPWDGTWNSLRLPDGTYYYIFFFEAGNRSKAVKGDLTILR